MSSQASAAARLSRPAPPEAFIPVERFMSTKEMAATTATHLGDDDDAQRVEMAAMRKQALDLSTSLGQKLAQRFGYLPETLASDLDCFVKAIERLNGGEHGGAEDAGDDREEESGGEHLPTMNVHDRLFRSRSSRWNKKKPEVWTTIRASSTRSLSRLSHYDVEHQKQSTIRASSTRSLSRPSHSDAEHQKNLRKKQNGRYKPRIRPPVPIQEETQSRRKQNKMMMRRRKKRRKKEKPPPSLLPSRPKSHGISPGTPRTIKAAIPRQEEESALEQAEYLRELATGQVKQEEEERLAAGSRPPPDGSQSPVATQLLARDLFHASIDMYSHALHNSADCAKAFLGRSYAYRRLGNAKRALVDLDMVLNLLAMPKQVDAHDLEDPEDEDRRRFSSDDDYCTDDESFRNPLRLSALWNMKGSLLIQAGLLEEGLASLLHAIRLEGLDGRSIDRFRAEYAHHYRQVRSAGT